VNNTGNPQRRRFLWLTGVGTATAVAVGLLIAVLPRQQPARAATPDPLPITAPTVGAPPVTLAALARAALTDTVSTDGTVDHLVIDSWNLNSVIDGQDVTSAIFPSRRELWRTRDDQGCTIDITLPPQFRDAADRAAFGDGATPDSKPERTDFPAGTFPASFTGRPPTDPAQLAGWLARTSTRDNAIFAGVTDLLRERALTSSERAAILTVLDDYTTLAYAGTSTDRAGRHGAAFTVTSNASGGQNLHVLLIDPANGRFLASEEILTGGAPALKVTYPAVLSYHTYRQADTVTAIP
jgi:hypothetical protein